MDNKIIAFILMGSLLGCSKGFEVRDPDLSGTVSQSSQQTPNPVQSIRNPYVCRNNSAALPSPQFRRLTKREYQTTLVDLFRGRVASEDVSSVTGLIPEDSAGELFENTSTSQITAEHRLGYMMAAEGIAALVAQNLSILTLASGESCLATSTAPTDDCVTKWILAFAARAFRRPVTAVEATPYLSLYKATSTKAESVALVLEGLLQSAHFLYRLEGLKSNGLTPFELATRLSYLVTGSMPDDILMAKATANSLSASELSAQADRLLQTANAKANIRIFYEQWLGYSPTATTAMKDEAGEFVVSLVSGKGTFRDLMSSRVGYLRTAEIAKLYGVGLPAADAARVTLPAERAGILSRAAVLSAYGTAESNPIKRGARLYKRVLCHEIAPPNPANFPVGTFTSPPADANSTTRERWTAKTSAPACMGCHSMLNPMGFAFENFDGFGKSRATEQIFDAQGTFVRERPIDASAIVNIDGVNRSVNGGAELSTALADSPEARACLSQRFVNSAWARTVDAKADSADSCSMSAIFEGLESGDLASMYRSFVTSSQFSQRLVP